MSYLSEHAAIYKRLLERSLEIETEEYLEKYEGNKDMLISQRIVKDPDFMKLPGPQKTWGSVLSEIRRDVLAGHKVLIGDYGLGRTEGISMAEARELLFGEDSRAAQDKRDAVYSQFARPAFPIMVLESDSFVLIVHEYKGKVDQTTHEAIEPGGRAFSVRSVDKFGIVATHRHVVIHNPSGKTRRFYLPETDWLKERSMLDENAKQLENLLRRVIIFGWIACDVLTLMNCRNIQQIAYKPSRRELAHLPKVLQPSFVYHMLNIQRTKKVYTSLDMLTDDAFTRETKTNAKAHVVRGHFKETKTGLFWWNSFLRNNKNRETVGFVDKVYRIENKEN
ncbi:hypothetical protein D3C71_77650 [compost metagenome]